MAERVFLHIGLPKTGTTYLQQILWSNREVLAADGVTLPGSGHRDHLWAALDIQDRPNLGKRNPKAPGSWERLCAELDTTRGTGLVTHEFFCGATADQAATAIARLQPAEVHVVVTARHLAGMLAAGWQEKVKNGGRAGLREAASSTRPNDDFSWRTWDLGDVLERWSAAVPPERVHVVPMPGKGAAPSQHWDNLASVLGLAGEYVLPERPANESLGASQVELLRRVNEHLAGFDSAGDRGRWIRGYLAEKHLVAQDGDRFGLPDDLLDECRTRSRRAVDLIRERGFAVAGGLGSLDSLLVPEDLPAHRDVASVTDAELVDSATRLVAAMLDDVRSMTVRQMRRERRARSRRSGLASRLRRTRG